MPRIINSLLVFTILLAPVNKFFAFIGFRIHYHEILFLILIPLFLFSIKNYRITSPAIRLYIFAQWAYLIPVLASLLSFMYIQKGVDEYAFFLKALAILLVGNVFLTLITVWVTNTSHIAIEHLINTFVAAVAISSVYGLSVILIYVYWGVDLDNLMSITIPLIGFETDLVESSALGGFFRLSGLTSDPSVQASFSIIVLIYLTYSIFERHRWWLLAVFVVILAAFIVTMSGSGAVGLLAAYCVLALSRIGAISVGAALRQLSLVIVAISPVILLGIFFQDEALFFLASKLEEGGTTRTHADIAMRALEIGLDHPVFGIGFNNFAFAYNKYYGVSGYNAHNSWLTSFVELGMFGFLFKVAIACLVIFLAWRARVPLRAYFISGFIGMNVAALGYETGNLFFNQALVATLFLAMYLSKHRRSSVEVKGEDGVPRNA